MKKTVLSLILILCVLLSSFAFVSAEEVAVLSARATAWDENNEFDVIIAIDKMKTLTAFDFQLDFDSNYVKLKRIIPLPVLDEGNNVSSIATNSETGIKTLRFGWYTVGTISENCDLVKIHFALADNVTVADSEKEIQITLRRNGSLSDNDLKTFPVNYESCKVVLPVLTGDEPAEQPETEGNEENAVIPEEIVPDQKEEKPTEGEAENIPQAPTGGSRPNIPTATPETTPETTPDVTMVLVIGSVKIKANENTIINDVAPKIVNDRTMLPIRIVAETLGATVGWDDALKKVTITSAEGKVIEFVIGEAFALVDGEKYELDSPAFIENDRTYSPVRFVSENLLAGVEWNEELQQVTITK